MCVEDKYLLQLFNSFMYQKYMYYNFVLPINQILSIFRNPIENKRFRRDTPLMNSVDKIIPKGDKDSCVSGANVCTRGCVSAIFELFHKGHFIH